MDKNSIEYIEWLRRYILVHSYIYYERDYNVVSDTIYDKKAKELVFLQKSIDSSGSMYYNIFEDYDGSTGFDLYHKLTTSEKERIIAISNHVIKSYKGEKNENTKSKRGRSK